MGNWTWGINHRPLSSAEDGGSDVKKVCECGWKGTEQQRDPQVSVRRMEQSPGTRSAHHVLGQAGQEALVQDLSRDLLHFFFPLVPGESK